MATLLSPYLDRLRRHWAAMLLGGIVILLATGFLYRGVRDWEEGIYFCPTDALAESAWLERTLEPDERVGAFNAGILGYLSHRTVVNLDGSINNSVFGAIQEKELLRYLRDEEITYIADNPFFLDVAFGIYWGSGIRSITTLLEPVVEFGECVGNPWGATVVYRVPQHLGDQ